MDEAVRRLGRLAALLALALCGCAATLGGAGKGGDGPKPPKRSSDVAVPDAPWRTGPPSVAAGSEPALASPPVLLRGARILVGNGTEIAAGHLLMRDGRIAAVGPGDGEAPAGATVIEAGGKTLTPGLIDTHSHLGVYPVPFANAHRDGNEMSGPVTPGVRAVDAFWPQDPSIERAVAGGVTTIQVLPGSGNLIGGRAVTLKLRRLPAAEGATSPRAMHFAGAPDGLKMACGENPKRVYGERHQKPLTRMGNVAVQRDAFHQARRLIAEWDSWRESERLRLEKMARQRADVADKRARRERQRRACAAAEASAMRCKRWQEQWEGDPLRDPEPIEPKLPPKRDPDLETLAAALEGRVLVQVHCYRADDMAAMIALADEVGFSIRSFHHALEAYKIRGELARRAISVSTWADWWGFKMEAYDGIPENLALVAAAGGRAIVHSDSAEGITRLNQEASKGMWAGLHAGIPLDEARAIAWVTLNPAWALGVDALVGSLEVGKHADVVLWDKSPFSVLSRAERVFIEGVERHAAGAERPRESDFEVGP
jgi:imidazolonepropionase-like amidohydrolase